VRRSNKAKEKEMLKRRSPKFDGRMVARNPKKAGDMSTGWCLMKYKYKFCTEN